MEQERWHQFCGHNYNFTTWSENDFGHCFEQVLFICLSHAVLAIVNAYFIAFPRRHFHNSRIYVAWTFFLVLRFILSLCLIILPIIQILISSFILKVSPSISDCIECGLLCFTWVLHSVFVWNIRYLHTVSLRGPVCMFLAILLVLAAQIIHVRTVILQRLEKIVIHNNAEEYSTYLALCLIISYILTLIPCAQRAYKVHVLSQNINYDGQYTEPITWDHFRSYGSISHISIPRETVVAEKGVNCLSWLTFHWVHPLMVTGSKGEIENVNDVYELPERLDTYKIESKFCQILTGKESKLNQEDPEDIQTRESIQNNQDVVFRSRSSQTKKQTSPKTLFQALNSAFGWEYYSLGSLKLLADCFGFAGPILLNLLVTFIEKKSEPEFHGYLYASGLLLSTFFGTLCSTQFDYNSQVVAFKMRCAIITTVYRKALTVNSVSRSRFNTGEIVNFMSTDTDRIVNFCPSFHAFWSLPFQIAVSLFLLYNELGLSFLAGLAFAILLIPINRKLAIKIGQLSTCMMEQKDSRVKLMNEMLCGIRVLKFYSWENHFMERIGTIRTKELNSLKGRKYLDALCVYFWATTPVLISILTFTTYVLLGNQLTAATVFTSLSLFSILIAPLNAFPWVINGLMEAWVSLKRVQKFCSLKDLNFHDYYMPVSDLDVDVVIHIKGGKFSWREYDKDAEMPPPVTENGLQNSYSEGTLILSDINIRVSKGQLVGVIGRVGCGKSSLLNAMLAEMGHEHGEVFVCNLKDGFALATQEAWIQNATVRDNILFHQPYNPLRYEAVMRACALHEDLKVLPAGDQTEVGENGVTLSGGQKARLALARAVYQDKEVYLLDDPLAAVDAHVAQHLMQQCIMGLLHNKTRILCTHNVHLLTQADVVIVMENGRIIQAGQPSEILPHVHLGNEEESEKRTQENNSEDTLVGEDEGKLMEKEEKAMGVVRLSVYSAYWKAVGTFLSAFVLLSLFLMQASKNVSDWWLSYWISNSHSIHVNKSIQPLTIRSWKGSHLFFLSGFESLSNTTPITNITESEDNVTFYLMIYGCLAGANSIFTLVRAFLFAYGGICAARVLHQRLLTSVLKAPMDFFDTTPLGRIINRFSSDIYAIDDSLPFQLNIFLAQIFGILGSLVITCYSLPWFTLCLVPLGFIYYKIQFYYRHTSRELKRISNITLSPLYAHFSESIMGLTTIRAYRQTEIFQKENMDRLSSNQKAQFSTQAAARWLDLRLRMLGVAIVGSISFIAVLQHHFSGVDPGLVGLALTYCLSVTNLLGGVVMFFTETEKQFVSVERADHYITSIHSEHWTGTLFPPSHWPKFGKVTYKGVYMRYRPGLPCALNGVSFETCPGEKLGIVGRTGSGKSSLFLTLFRMVEITQGEISVDDMNLRYLDLSDIRSRFAIIPQDPFLFSGSVRMNLDPQCLHSDDELFGVLGRCHLADVVEHLGGLEADVGERGHLFSVGQRQLMCLARALLTKAKVLCIDEATASVDQETDRLVQVTIRQEFASSTVLTIAHRINTVLDSDRVLVMKGGMVAELAPPDELLQDSQSLFYQLVHGRH